MDSDKICENTSTKNTLKTLTTNLSLSGVCIRVCESMFLWKIIAPKEFALQVKATLRLDLSQRTKTNLIQGDASVTHSGLEKWRIQ